MRQQHVKSSFIERLQLGRRQGLNRYLRRLARMDLHQFASWPHLIKVLCWIILFVVLIMLGYWVWIKPQQQSLARAQLQQQNLLNQLKLQQKQLINFKQSQIQLQQLQNDLEQQFAQLPKATDVATLLEDIQQAGIKSGLKIKNIRLESTVQQALLIEQPIMIEAQGDYHAFGRFASKLAELQYLVSLHDFVIQRIETQEKQLDSHVLEYHIQAKTYRYVSLDFTHSPINKNNIR